MLLDSEACYRALLARDRRYDGRFFTCVKSTGIYCRPVCPARTPRQENCLFVPSAAAAQQAGYRPCLRCRPETSPQKGVWLGTSSTVSRALSMIEAGVLDGGDVASLAARLGVGERHLRRLFKQHLGASPVRVAQTRRLLLAKQLLHDTDLTMTEVALASGYASLRRFNEAFASGFSAAPTALRRHRKPAAAREGLRLQLPYRAPYDFRGLLAFFAARALPGIEEVTPHSYARVITFEGEVGTLDVRDLPTDAALEVTIRFPRLAALPSLLGRVRAMFDLDADPEGIAATLRCDPSLAPLVRARPGLRIPGGWDAFEIAVRAILGQQVTVAAATGLVSRFAARFGTTFVGDPRFALAFPEPGRWDPDVIAKLGMPGARARTLVATAEAVRADPNLLSPRQDLETAVAALCALPGIGPWTANYIAMRALRECDAFLSGDAVLKKMLCPDVAGTRSAARLIERAESFRPFRAYAALHLWAAADDERTQTHHGAQHAAST